MEHVNDQSYKNEGTSGAVIIVDIFLRRSCSVAQAGCGLVPHVSTSQVRSQMCANMPATYKENDLWMRSPDSNFFHVPFLRIFNFQNEDSRSVKSQCSNGSNGGGKASQSYARNSV